jgi:hypothetical protein
MVGWGICACSKHMFNIENAISRVAIAFSLICVLIALGALIIELHRDLRDLKEAYKQQYGREYSDGPSKVKYLFSKAYGFFCRFFSLLR